MDSKQLELIVSIVLAMLCGMIAYFLIIYIYNGYKYCKENYNINIKELEVCLNKKVIKNIVIIHFILVTFGIVINSLELLLIPTGIMLVFSAMLFNTFINS